MPRKPRAEFEVTARDRSLAVLNQIDGNVQRLTRTATVGARALGGFVGAAGVFELAQLADQYNALSIRIRTATKDTGDFNQVQRELIALSAQTGAGLEATVDTFQALSRVREDIGATNEQMIALTRTVQQLGVIGGSSGENLRNGLRQFNQALSAGVFRAEEFNSIVENTPELARRIADGLGVTQGALRQLVIDGQLFADDVINTLLRQAPEIADEFEEIPVTLDRAFSDLGTSIGTAASELDTFLGTSSAAATVLSNIARELRLVSGTASNQEVLQDQLEGLQRQIDDTSNRLEALGATRKGSESELFLQLTAELETLQAQAQGTRDALEFFENPDLGQVDAARPVDTDAIERELDQFFKQEERFFRDRAALAQQSEDLRLRSLKEFAESVREEEARQRADELARAAGYASDQARLEAEREEFLFRTRLETRARRFEEELAQEQGFASTREEALAVQDEEFQRRRVEAQFRGNDLARRAALDLLRFEKATAVERTRFVLGQAQSLTQGLSQSSRALFNINKLAAGANAVVNTAEGVTAALKLGPAGIPLAALIAAQGAAQIATIASTQFGGAASGLSSSGPGTGVPSLAANNPLRDIPLVTSDDRNQSAITLRIEAGDDLAGAILEGVAVEVDQGDQTFITERSRQAIEIRR